MFDVHHRAASGSNNILNQAEFYSRFRLIASKGQAHLISRTTSIWIELIKKMNLTNRGTKRPPVSIVALKSAKMTSCFVGSLARETAAAARRRLAMIVVSDVVSLLFLLKTCHTRDRSVYVTAGCIVYTKPITSRAPTQFIPLVVPYPLFSCLLCLFFVRKCSKVRCGRAGAKSKITRAFFASPSLVWVGRCRKVYL